MTGKLALGVLELALGVAVATGAVRGVQALANRLRALRVQVRDGAADPFDDGDEL